LETELQNSVFQSNYQIGRPGSAGKRNGTYPDLSYLAVARTRWRTIIARSLWLTLAIIVFAQLVNAYFVDTLIGDDRLYDALMTLQTTFVVALPFSIFCSLLQVRTDVAADYFRLLSRTDHLTGLLNRRAFIDVLEGSKKSVSIGKASGALFVIDLDHFKQVNDDYGHDAGDAVLCQVADLFRSNLRADDVVARMGGEEFVIALSRGTARETWNVAQRLREAVEQKVFQYDEQEMRLTISLGIVRYDFDENLESAMRKADLLTYQSKKDGRNRISCNEGQFGLQPAV
tara:strand:- start:19415 stop:20275 length:861 start_codon:yes stop_codon:yes gene_type:complete